MIDMLLPPSPAGKRQFGGLLLLFAVILLAATSLAALSGWHLESAASDASANQVGSGQPVPAADIIGNTQANVAGISPSSTPAPATSTPTTRPTSTPTFTPEPTNTPLPTSTQAPTDTPTPQPPATSTPAPPTSTPQPPPANTPIRQYYYTVQPGDTLGTIAWRFRSSVNAIMQANRLTMQSILYPGQVLVIPTGR